MSKLAELFKGPRAKWFLGAGAVVILLGVVALRRNQSSGAMMLEEYPTYGAPSDGSTGGGVTEGEVQAMVGSLTRDFSAAIKAQQDQNTKLAQQFGDSLASTQTAFAQMFNAYSQQTSQQLAGITDNVNKTLLERAQTQVSSSYQSPIVDNSDQSVYGASSPYIGGNAATGSKQPAFGYGGVDYNKADNATKKAVEANEARLKQDAAFRQSELERANKVITERKAAGLDTKEQEAYKAKVSKMAG